VITNNYNTSEPTESAGTAPVRSSIDVSFKSKPYMQDTHLTKNLLGLKGEPATKVIVKMVPVRRSDCNLAFSSPSSCATRAESTLENAVALELRAAPSLSRATPYLLQKQINRASIRNQTGLPTSLKNHRGAWMKKTIDGGAILKLDFGWLWEKRGVWAMRASGRRLGGIHRRCPSSA
jgi:hypothetical protein